MSMMVSDLVVDSLQEELIESALLTLRGGRLIKDPKDPTEPWLTEDGFLVVRVRDRDPVAYARELQRRVGAMRIVSVVDRTPKENSNGT